MSEYVRTTRDCSVSQLHPELLQAILTYMQEHQLGNLQSETILCCETVSRKKEAGTLLTWLNGASDTTIYTGMLLASDWLLWAHYGDRSGTRVNAASLHEIRANYYRSLLTQDTGLEIVGFIGDANARVRGHIGMGPEAAAEKFCEAVQQAIQDARPPAKKDLFKWLGG